MQAMVQSLLADRFKLKLHRETKMMSVYALVVGKSGAKLETARTTCAQEGCNHRAPGIFNARYATIASTASILSNLVDRPVLDQTGLVGRYDFRVTFDQRSANPNGMTTPSAATDGPSIFAAIQDLGLRLEPQRAAVKVVVIDRAEKPDAN
jgi:uncharacterized protein (TIGR03435 family)